MLMKVGKKDIHIYLCVNYMLMKATQKKDIHNSYMQDLSQKYMMK